MELRRKIKRKVRKRNAKGIVLVLTVNRMKERRKNEGKTRNLIKKLKKMRSWTSKKKTFGLLLFRRRKSVQRKMSLMNFWTIFSFRFQCTFSNIGKYFRK